MGEADPDAGLRINFLRDSSGALRGGAKIGPVCRQGTLEVIRKV